MLELDSLAFRPDGGVQHHAQERSAAVNRKWASDPACQVDEVSARYRRMVSLEWSVVLSSLTPEASLDNVRRVQGREP